VASKVTGWKVSPLIPRSLRQQASQRMKAP